jgi:hypothetical protein
MKYEQALSVVVRQRPCIDPLTAKTGVRLP